MLQQLDQNLPNMLNMFLVVAGEYEYVIQINKHMYNVFSISLRTSLINAWMMARVLTTPNGITWYL